MTYYNYRRHKNKPNKPKKEIWRRSVGRLSFFKIGQNCPEIGIWPSSFLKFVDDLGLLSKRKNVGPFGNFGVKLTSRTENFHEYTSK